MQKTAAFYDTLMQGYGPLFSAAKPQLEALQPLPIFQVRRGLAESPGWFMIQAVEFDPEPLTVDGLRVRDIYASESIVHALLELLAGEKWFDRVGYAYHLTKAGREQATTINQRLWEPLSKATPTIKTDVQRLATLMRRTLDASLQSATPSATWCLRYSCRRRPPQDAAALVQIYHYLSDYNAFRDDAHMAAWQPLGVQGYQWEAFSLVLAGKAEDADDLFDQLAYRGYARLDYQAALDNLVERGWLVVNEGCYQLTETGRATHQQVETLTDSAFYGPWVCLDETETQELETLLTAFSDEMKEEHS